MLMEIVERVLAVMVVLSLLQSAGSPTVSSSDNMVLDRTQKKNTINSIEIKE